MRRSAFVAAALAVALFPVMAGAAEHEVQMLNKGEKGMMVFEPAFLQAAPGDTIKFVPTDKGHYVEGVKNMIPEGVEPFRSKMNEEFVLTVEKDGVYGVKCTPHYGMGMVALIVAGEPVNIEEAKAVKQTGKAKKVFGDLFAQAGQ